MADILEQETKKALISMSVPISIGMLSTFLFQVIDTYFVGQLGPEALAALSFSSTLYFIMIGLFIGLSVGVSILVGEAQGAGDEGTVKSIATIGVVIATLLAVGLSALLIFFLEPIFQLLGAKPTIIPMIKEYLVPLISGVPLLTFGLVGGGALRATGNVNPPEVIMGIAGVINLVFDYLLIFGIWSFPEMGIKGAAIATVLSWMFVVIGMFIFLFRKRLLNGRALFQSGLLSKAKTIFTLAFPTIITQIIGPFTLMYLIFLLAQESQLAVAAFGVASRVETLLLIGILGVSTAITPFVAQNAGAKKQLRIDEAIAFGGKSSTYLGLIMALILFVTIRPIAGLFTDSVDVIENTVNYFYLLSLSYVFYGLFLITTSIYNGLQLPTNSLRITLIKTVAFTIPFTLIGSYWGVFGIFLGLAVSNVAAGLYAGHEMKKTFRKMNSPLADVSVWREYTRDLNSIFKW